MLKFITLCCIMLLSGCSVESWEFNQAQKVCAAHEGVSNLRIDPLGPVYIQCNDGFNQQAARSWK